MQIFVEAHPEAHSYEVILYGTLAETGRAQNRCGDIKRFAAPR